MKKVSMTIIALIASLSLLSGAAVAKGNQGKGNAGGNQTKAKTVMKEKAAKEIKSRVTSMSPEQKDKIHNQLKDREKKAVKRQFSDASGHWAKNRIEKVQSLGLINGYEDGTFKPDDPVTAAEAMVMAVNLSEAVTLDDGTTGDGTAADGTTEDGTTEDGTTEDGTTEDGTAEDGTVDEGTGEEGTGEVPGWAREKAQKAAALKIINVNRFHSQVQATRAQAAVMVAKALGLEPVDTSTMTFSDAVLISSEDIGYILALKEAGIVQGSPDGKFNPNSSVTRAEIAAMLANAVDTVDDQTGGTDDDGTADEGTGTTEGTVTTDQATQTEEETGTTDQATQITTGTGDQSTQTDAGTGITDAQ